MTTYGADVGPIQAFVAEFVGTFMLAFIVFGVIDGKAPVGFAGLAIGSVVFAAIISVAPATGASINPARTFGPMLVQQLAGGAVQWSQLPVYFIGEFSAGVAAALVYTVISRTRADGTTVPRPGSRPRTQQRVTESHGMKKLINDPADVVTEALRGIAAAHPDRFGSTTRTRSSTAATRQSRQGRADLRRRLRARAAARRLRRARHARRRLRR